MTAEARSRLLELIRERALKRGHFVLSSGRTSTYYLDNRLVTLDAEGAYLTGKILVDLLRDTGVEAIGGPTLGADPIAAATITVGFLEGRRFDGFIVRKEPKAHGRQRLIEGPLKEGARVAIVDDTITTGGSFLKAIAAVRELGCIVERVIVIVDRAEGGRETLAAQGCELTAIYSIDEVLGEPIAR
ncbi:MAG: orotate phosphoribosyltransferase [Chloroflexi bacterium]|nr:orotate phosphoribosyltransferase [Chloroflexota bacterium]